jgi:hypothetical protein
MGGGSGRINVQGQDKEASAMGRSQARQCSGAAVGENAFKAVVYTPANAVETMDIESGKIESDGVRPPTVRVAER